MPNGCPDLEPYLRWLQNQISDAKVPDEKALSRTVSDIYGLPDTKTLLDALGYPHGSPQVFPEYQVTIGSQTYQVDFRLGAESFCWMLELKSPDEVVDKPRFVDQIHTYLAADRSPDRTPPVLGVLFNGREAQMYLNVEHPKLKQFSDIHRKAIASAKIEQPSQMAAFFEPLQACELPSLLDNARKTARSFLRAVKVGVAKRQRQEQIRHAICQLIQEPEPQVVEAIISTDPVLTSLSPRPSVQEVSDIWCALAPRVGLVTSGDKASEYGPAWYREQRYNPESVAAFFDFAGRASQLFSSLGMSLNVQYNRGSIAYKRGGRRVFRLYWFGSRSFGCALRIPEPEARRLCPTTARLKDYDSASGEAAFAVDPSQTRPEHFEELVKVAYMRLGM